MIASSLRHVFPEISRIARVTTLAAMLATAGGATGPAVAVEPVLEPVKPIGTPAKPARPARKQTKPADSAVTPAVGAAGAGAATMTAPKPAEAVTKPTEPVVAPKPADAVPAQVGEGGALPFVPVWWDKANRPLKPLQDVTAIRFLTSGDFPPLSFLDSGGRLMGYQVDLARMICGELGATCTIQMRPFDDLVTALGEKRGDAIIAGLAVPSSMRDRLETSDAYLGTPGRFVARRETTFPALPEGLVGRWISVVSGSAHEAFLLDNFPKARIAAYPDEATARDALRDGRVDAHFGDAMGLSYWIEGSASRGCCGFREGPYLESAYFGEGMRIAVTKGNTRLRQNIDYALRRLAAEGRLGELYLRWFPRGYY